MQTHTHSKPKTSLYQFRIDEQEKARAFAVIESMGLKPAQALRLFLHRVSSTNALPFPIETRPNHGSNCPLAIEHIPNEETQKVMREVDAGIGLKEYSSKDALFAHLRNLTQQHA